MIELQWLVYAVIPQKWFSARRLLNDRAPHNASRGSTPLHPESMSQSLEKQIAGSNGSHPVLGARIRALRKRKALTLARLAELSGISVGHISLIERNLTHPSISALVGLAKALGVTVRWFFDEEGALHDDEYGYVVRARDRMKIRFEGGIVDELLTSKESNQLEVLCSRFPAGAESSEMISHAGEEAGVVLVGQLELWVGERHFILSEGDSFNFASSEPHRYRNPGASECVAIWVITPPSY